MNIYIYICVCVCVCVCVCIFICMKLLGKSNKSQKLNKFSINISQI